MAKSDDVERRLLNWVRWRIGGASGGTGYASSRWGGTPGTSAYRDSVIPTSAAEAIETDAVIQRLDQDLLQLVMDHYADGLSMAALAVKRDCSVATAYARLGRLHQLLGQAFHDMAEARRAERKRVESLARASKP